MLQYMTYHYDQCCSHDKIMRVMRMAHSSRSPSGYLWWPVGESMAEFESDGGESVFNF